MIFQTFGSIANPFNTLNSASPLAKSSGGYGLFAILGAMVQMVIVTAGLYTLWNLIIAGYGFLNAGGEAKYIEKAWAKIWQSLIGLLIVAGSFVLAAIFGYLIFGDASMLISPRVFTPES
jgi:hypothetical protein